MLHNSCVIVQKLGKAYCGCVQTIAYHLMDKRNEPVGTKRHYASCFD